MIERDRTEKRQQMGNKEKEALAESMTLYQLPRLPLLSGSPSIALESRFFTCFRVIIMTSLFTAMFLLHLQLVDRAVYVSKNVLLVKTGDLSWLSTVARHGVGTSGSCPGRLDSFLWRKRLREIHIKRFTGR